MLDLVLQDQAMSIKAKTIIAVKLQGQLTYFISQNKLICI